MDAQPPLTPEPPATPPAPSAPAPEPPRPGPAPAALPWEQPGAPVLESMLATIQLLLLRPREAFQRMAVTGSYARPMLLALVLGVLGIVIASSYAFVLGRFWSHVYDFTGFARGPDFAPLAKLVVGVVGSPFLLAIGVLVGTAIYHLFLMLFGASAGGVGATFRVVCYTEAACALFAVVPVVGDVVGAVWRIVVCIVGFAVVHRTTTGKAAAAVLTPILLCLACCLPFAFWRLVTRMW